MPQKALNVNLKRNNNKIAMTKQEFLEDYAKEVQEKIWTLDVEIRFLNRKDIINEKITPQNGKPMPVAQVIGSLKVKRKDWQEKLDTILDELKDAEGKAS